MPLVRKDTLTKIGSMDSIDDFVVLCNLVFYKE